MYQQRRSGPPIFLIIILGIVVGVGFLVFSNLNQEPAEEIINPDDPDAITVEDQAADIEQQLVESAPTLDPEILENPLADGGDLGGEATIFVPSAAIYANVVRVYLDGTSWDVSKLGENIGHLQGTSWLGDPGNIVLSGHVELSDGRRGIFANLEQIKVGDFIIMQQNEEEWRFIVTEKKTTAPDDLSPLYPTDADRLTLITCDNYDFFQDSYLDRTIIVAEKVSS